jgi:cell division protein FtsA
MREEKEVYAVGLDVGNSRVCAVAGKRDEKGMISLLGVAEAYYNNEYESMRRGEVKNEENVLSTVGKVIEDLSEKAGLELAVANCSYSGSGIQLKTGKEEFTNNGEKIKVSDYQLEMLLRKAFDNQRKNERVKLLHILPKDFYIDDEIIAKNPRGSVGNKLGCMFNYIQLPKETYEAYLKSLEGIPYSFFNIKTDQTEARELYIDQLVYTGVADAMACLSSEDKNNGILLVNFGAQLTEITIFKEAGLRFSQVLPVGANLIISDLCSAFSVDEDQAVELIKVGTERRSKDVEINEVIQLRNTGGTAGRQFLHKSVALVIESRIKEIAGLVAKAVIDSDYHRVLGNGIMLTGASARLPLTQYLFEKTFSPLPFRVANPGRNIDINMFLEIAHPKYSTAVGTMLTALEPVDQRIPLIKVPKDRHRFGKGLFRNLPFPQVIKDFFDEPELRRRYNE